MIRTFQGETWICGWFDENGVLKDVQQYSDEEQANACAADLKKRHMTFVGKIVDVTEYEVVPDGSIVISVAYEEYNPTSYGGVYAIEDESNGIMKVFMTGDFDKDLQNAIDHYPNKKVYKSSKIDHYLHDKKLYDEAMSEAQIGVGGYKKCEYAKYEPQ